MHVILRVAMIIWLFGKYALQNNNWFCTSLLSPLNSYSITNEDAWWHPTVIHLLITSRAEDWKPSEMNHHRGSGYWVRCHWKISCSSTLFSCHTHYYQYYFYSTIADVLMRGGENSKEHAVLLVTVGLGVSLWQHLPGHLVPSYFSAKSGGVSLSYSNGKALSSSTLFPIRRCYIIFGFCMPHGYLSLTP